MRIEGIAEIRNAEEIRIPHFLIHISLVETVIHWPRTSVELQDGAVGT